MRGFKLCCVLMIGLQLTSFAEEPEEVTPKVKTDFLRDVMMPLGVPLVSAYQSMRENYFMNIKCKNASVLESMGNFFLTPSRFLFGGKTVQIDENDQCRIYPSFHYEKMNWFKSTLAVIAFPVGEVLGVTCKGLAHLSPSVRKRNAQTKKAMRMVSIVSHDDEYIENGVTEFYSDEFIPCQGHKRPSKLSDSQKKEIKVLKEIVELLEAHHILYWLDCGTCLGSYRYGGFIPWDWDIDIAILMPDHENVKRVLSQLDRKRFQVQDWSSYSNPNSFMKIYVKETKNFIDVYHYRLNEKEQTLSYFFTYEDSPFPTSWKQTERKFTKPLKYETVFPLKKANFDGLVVRAPNDVVKFLQTKYGENLDPVMVWDEERKNYLKVEGHPYWDN